MGKLTSHVLDTHSGVPASGIRIELRQLTSAGSQLLGVHVTAENGRCADPLLQDELFQRGRYELTFHIADYFRAHEVTLPDLPFIEAAVVRIGIAHPDQHYHVPLLITPWSYSVYRGG